MALWYKCITLEYSKSITMWMYKSIALQCLSCSLVITHSLDRC